MNATSLLFSKIISSEQGAREHYHVPKYQREYSWGKKDWEQLLIDINDNDPGYFMGSVICVKDNDQDAPGNELVYEVIDGQQRLTTLSLLMLAIYVRLHEQKDTFDFEDDEDLDDYRNMVSSLRCKIVKRKKSGEWREGEFGGWKEGSKMSYYRVQPSSQNNNLDDYRYLIGDAGIVQAMPKPRYLGVRGTCKAYRYFSSQIPSDFDALRSLVGKINQLQFVFISVGTQADAFTLFEALNNRGVPLSAIDIIKNKILAEMEKQHQVDIDDSYETWQEIVRAIPDDKDQERFLRHFYHAFRWDPAIRVEGIPRAIRSKVISIYEKLIKQDARSLFSRLHTHALLYGKLIDPEDTELDEDLQSQLTDLERINAAPTYQLLLFLFSLPEDSIEGPDFLGKVLSFLRRWYVRRTVTDYPANRDLDQAFIDVIATWHEIVKGGDRLTYEAFRNSFVRRTGVSSIEDFEKALRGSIYDTSSVITRYLLIKLDEQHNNREYKPDLWARNDKDKTVWTIEHVLPQTDKISPEWVKMIAGGDLEAARAIKDRQLHRLGNLTLSGFNSKLSTAPFQQKQTLAQNKSFLGHKINIGYQNELALNKLPFSVNGDAMSLAIAPRWTEAMIDARTDVMVNTLLDIYHLEGVDEPR